MSLIHNEQRKLTATWLIGVAIAAIAVGAIAPLAAAMLMLAILSGVIWTAAALTLDYAA